jgi:hypothetical protein
LQTLHVAQMGRSRPKREGDEKQAKMGSPNKKGQEVWQMQQIQEKSAGAGRGAKKQASEPTRGAGWGQ